MWEINKLKLNEKVQQENKSPFGNVTALTVFGNVVLCTLSTGVWVLFFKEVPEVQQHF